jgi:NADP-dependent 3-hydroxy acid dehydrogenase YdfG
MIDNCGWRVSLVTGASWCIGLAIAPAAEGFDLTISARSAGALDKCPQRCAEREARSCLSPLTWATSGRRNPWTRRL